MQLTFEKLTTTLLWALLASFGTGPAAFSATPDASTSARDALIERAIAEEEDHARARAVLQSNRSIRSFGLQHGFDASPEWESNSGFINLQALLDEAEALQDEYESGQRSTAPHWSALHQQLDSREIKLSYRVRAYRFMSRDVSVKAAVRERYERETLRLASERLDLRELTDSDVDELMKSRQWLSENGAFAAEWRSFYSELYTAYSAWTRRYLEVVEGPYRAPTPAQVRDLFHEAVDAGTYRNGEYERTPRLFMFCRHQRQYPCLLVMKDRLGQPVEVPGERSGGFSDLFRNDRLWNQPSLGLSKYGKKFDENSGYTPSGVYQMDGVMPKANDPLSYGKFRRIILNFIDRSPDEIFFQSLLPKSHWNLSWWKESVIARNLGRNSLRIHGTGILNRDSDSPYYPLYPTSGCIAQRENNYPEASYQDQRRLLDQLMVSLGLEAVFRNEVQIKGLLYVLEINDVAAPVTLRDLQALGIH